MNKGLEPKSWSQVLKLLICLLPMQEVVKLDCSVELVSEKQSSFNNWSTTWLKLTVVIQSSLVWVKELEKVTISTTKWFNLVSLRLMGLDLDAHWFTVKWMNPQELELELDWLDLLLPNISEMKKEKMCCFSSTTFSDLLKLALKCLPF